MDVVAACTQDNIGGEKGVVRSKSRLVQGQTRPTAALTGRVPRHWFSRLDYAPVRDADDRAGCSADPRLLRNLTTSAAATASATRWQA